MILTTAKNLPEFNRFAVAIEFRNKDNNNLGEAHIEVDFVMRYAFCAAFLAIFLMMIALIVKLLWISDGDEASSASRRPTESTTLLPSKGQEFVVTIYGTNDSDHDHCESGSNNGCSSSSEDLYDGKICVICYDDQRNCFFIPCGHCVTCHKCAHRIVKEESKSCPICRGIIYKSDATDIRSNVEIAASSSEVGALTAAMVDFWQDTTNRDYRTNRAPGGAHGGSGRGRRGWG
ncbi:RING/U-box superfamily protein [Striga hermonthica]|uniref:RING/U-box superfamily protein n=1 Tax=Striga hermonthica TaxID=68872 RepID=A0A9N7NMP6_STRHE|nr:RING/U-box superfamily protein [Striga hermonthica]